MVGISFCLGGDDSCRETTFQDTAVKLGLVLIVAKIFKLPLSCFLRILGDDWELRLKTQV